MYINWIHHYLPRLFGLLAFLVNPVFIYLIFTEKVANFGNYRYILLSFASFDLVYSGTVFLLPVHVYNYRYSFSIFISEGWFQPSSDFNFFLLAARCSLVSGSYAILLSHFCYRFLVIRDSVYVSSEFHIFLLASFGAFLAYSWIWFSVGYFLTFPGGKDYIREHFRETFGEDPDDFNIFTAIYNEAPTDSVVLSFFGLISLTVLSMLTCLLFVTLGFLTMRKINRMVTNMSISTAKLQRELLKALAVQTAIPIFISFSPCLLAWYSPMFNLDMGKAISMIEVVNLAAFPFLDPIAIVLCLPVLRRRIFRTKKVVKIQSIELNTTIQ